MHEHLQTLNLRNVMMDFDASSLYPSAMWDKKSVYPKMETGFTSKPHMNKTSVDAFNNQTFNQDGDESGNLRIKYYNPPNLVFQHLLLNEKVKNIEINRMRNGYIIDTLTSVDIQEIIKFGEKVIRIFEGVFYSENLDFLHLGKV